MARLATAIDFEGQASDSLYSSYQKFPYFSQRADWVLALHGRLVRAGRLTTTPQTTKVIVAGAGYGYLVEELIARGFDAIGFDASAYAIQKMNGSVNLTTRGRVFNRDMLNAADYNALKTSANLKRNDKWHIGITEDVLPCMSDAEVLQAVPFARDGCSNLVHIITPGVVTDPSRVSPLNWKTMVEWRTFLTVNNNMPDWLLNAEGNPFDNGQPNTSLEYPPTGWIEPAP